MDLEKVKKLLEVVELLGIDKVVIGGSLGLYLYGCNLQRDLGDLDIIVDRKTYLYLLDKFWKPEIKSTSKDINTTPSNSGSCFDDPFFINCIKEDKNITLSNSGSDFNDMFVLNGIKIEVRIDENMLTSHSIINGFKVLNIEYILYYKTLYAIKLEVNKNNKHLTDLKNMLWI